MDFFFPSSKLVHPVLYVKKMYPCLTLRLRLKQSNMTSHSNTRSHVVVTTWCCAENWLLILQSQLFAIFLNIKNNQIHWRDNSHSLQIIYKVFKKRYFVAFFSDLAPEMNAFHVFIEWNIHYYYSKGVKPQIVLPESFYHFMSTVKHAV